MDERKQITDDVKQPTVVGQPSTMSPGDQVAPGTPGAGENVCPRCGGKGQQGNTVCTTCSGTGRVIEAVGGGG